MTVAAKYSYFSTLKNVSRTWFRRPIRDWIFRVLGLICPCLYGRILPSEELISCRDASALFEETNKQHSFKNTCRLSCLRLIKAAAAQGRCLQWLCNQTPGNALEWRVRFSNTPGPWQAPWPLVNGLFPTLQCYNPNCLQVKNQLACCMQDNLFLLV